ncbi:hypothetical protein DPMN_052581 [Dreissena polymorpha]|uniref:Uncharacterized protein n=1 Tax=Dreissena polymorpha TaxID=45954 RepID=A0A9D4CLJ0_DREPO|nr:hypothetical protein DPMN_052581 [Dreissena polymorpha]
MAQAIHGLAKKDKKDEEPTRNNLRCNWCFKYHGPKLVRHQTKWCSNGPVGASFTEEFAKENVKLVKENYAAFVANKAVPEGFLPAASGQDVCIPPQRYVENLN